MKKYLIEIEGGRIWTNEYDGARFKLMRPYGEKSQACEEYVDYCDWFQEKFGREADVCLLCSDEADRDIYDKLVELLGGGRSTWTDDDVAKFLGWHRDKIEPPPVEPAVDDRINDQIDNRIDNPIDDDPIDEPIDKPIDDAPIDEQIDKERNDERQLPRANAYDLQRLISRRLDGQCARVSSRKQ